MNKRLVGGEGRGVRGEKRNRLGGGGRGGWRGEGGLDGRHLMIASKKRKKDIVRG